MAWSKDLLLQSAILPDQQKRAHACLSASVGMSAWADSGLRAYPGGGGGGGAAARPGPFSTLESACCQPPAAAQQRAAFLGPPPGGGLEVRSG